MMKNISGKVFRKMILNGAKLIDVNKEHVDALNVFPVPDGDAFGGKRSGSLPK